VLTRIDIRRGEKRSAMRARAYGFATSNTLNSGCSSIPTAPSVRDRLVQRDEAGRQPQVDE
jgi:hypothetical protein